MTRKTKADSGDRIVATGPWPFITHRVFHRAGRADRIWQSRPHRKSLTGSGGLKIADIPAVLARALFRPHSLNWWIASLFALGSVLFMLGSIFSLLPAFAARLGFDIAAINAVFFAGSVPFTSAAFLQLYQAATAPVVGAPMRGLRVLRVHDIGWLSCALQFAGTLLFNINTFDAMQPDLNRVQYDLAVWVPDFLGSMLFLSSGYLAFIEVGHRHWSWHPRDISWLVTFINLLGCGAFMISAFLAFDPAHPFAFDAMSLSVVFTLIGAAAFLIGSLLMLPESVGKSHEDSPVTD